MASINTTLVATINGTQDNLFTNSLALPSEIELEVELMQKFFGSPEASLTVDVTSETVSGDVKFGPLNVPVTLPLELPAFVKSFLSKLTAQGIPAEIVADAKLVA